jgi:hypothetical protein
LASWLADAEREWGANSRATKNIRAASTSDERIERLTLAESLDYHGKLSAQFPTDALRVLYAKAGTQPAACILHDARVVVDHKAYWSTVHSLEEARYLTAILNSEEARARVEHFQSRGQWGARDFDKVMFELPIPLFDGADPVHAELVAAAARAEGVAATVDIAGMGFVRARQAIRAALRDDGVAHEIDRLVAVLLDR